MHFFTTFSLLVVFLCSIVLAAPLHDFTEIERRWSNGESEASIHANVDIREASPAWALRRAEPSVFLQSLDAQTQQRRRVVYGRNMDASLKAKVMSYIAEVFRSKGITEVIESRSERGIVEMDEAPVLKPRGSMRYHFTV